MLRIQRGDISLRRSASRAETAHQTYGCGGMTASSGQRRFQFQDGEKRKLLFSHLFFFPTVFQKPTGVIKLTRHTDEHVKTFHSRKKNKMKDMFSLPNRSCMESQERKMQSLYLKNTFSVECKSSCWSAFPRPRVASSSSSSSFSSSSFL